MAFDLSVFMFDRSERGFVSSFVTRDATEEIIEPSVVVAWRGDVASGGWKLTSDRLNVTLVPGRVLFESLRPPKEEYIITTEASFEKEEVDGRRRGW